MSREQPCCRQGVRFLGSTQGSTCLGALTGQDARALAAFLHLLDLYASADPHGRELALQAMALTVQAMQDSTRWLAKKAIPSVLDWDDEEKLWPLILWPLT